MGKIITFIVIGYLIYYAIQIVYDLFIKKSPVVIDKDDGELISLGQIEEDLEPNEVRKINIDQVEDIAIPHSFDVDSDDFDINDGEPTNSEADLNHLKKQYDEEQTLSVPEQVEKKSEDLDEEKATLLSKYSNATPDASKIKSVKSKTKLNISDEAFLGFFEKATTHTVRKVVNGHVAYTSTL